MGYSEMTLKLGVPFHDRRFQVKNNPLWGHMRLAFDIPIYDQQNNNQSIIQSMNQSVNQLDHVAFLIYMYNCNQSEAQALYIA
jgi:hypothetical protein